MDGELKISEPLAPYVLSPDKLKLGADNHVVNVDELAFYDQVLTLDEIEDIYSLDRPLKPYFQSNFSGETNLFHYWSFNKGEGNIATDRVLDREINITEEMWKQEEEKIFIKSSVFQQEKMISNIKQFTSPGFAISFDFKNSNKPLVNRGVISLKQNDTKLLSFFLETQNPRINYAGETINMYNQVDNLIPQDQAWHNIKIEYQPQEYNLNLYVDNNLKFSQDQIYLQDYPNKLEIYNDNYYYYLDNLKLWQIN